MRSVEYSNEAKRRLKALPQRDKDRIEDAISLLVVNPLLGKKLGDELRGKRSFRVWPYRIVYGFDASRLQVVVVGHRRDVYR